MTDTPVTITDRNGRHDFPSSADAEVVAIGYAGTLAELIAKAEAFETISKAVQNPRILDIERMETIEREVVRIAHLCVERHLEAAEACPAPTGTYGEQELADAR